MLIRADSDLLEKDDDKGGPEISGSVEPSALMDEQDMEEEEIGELVQTNHNSHANTASQPPMTLIA